MDAQDKLAAVMEALHHAALDDALWPHTWALVGEACATRGHSLIVGEGFGDDVKVHFAQFHQHGQRREDLERVYFEVYHSRDERLPRLRLLPDSEVVHVRDLYTEQELKSSPAYNEWMRQAGNQNGLMVRLAVPGGQRVVWSLGDCIAPGGWESHRIKMIDHLLPHLRQFVRVRQAVSNARGLGSSLGALLDNTCVGVIHLDRRGRIVETNARALDLLRRGDGLSDRNGFLDAWLPGDTDRLQRLLDGALPPFGVQAAAGSMTIRRSSSLPRLVLHITPVGSHQLDFGAQRVAALVLVVDAARRPQLDAELVAEALGLTAAESQVAVMLCEGTTTRDIAMTTGRQVNTVYMLIKRMYKKLGISRRAHLIRLLLSLVDVSAWRR